jgi:hypothetical protein
MMMMMMMMIMSRDSVVGIATGYGVDKRGQSSSPDRVKNSLFSTSSRYGSGAHPTYYPMGTGGSFPEDEAAEA